MGIQNQTPKAKDHPHHPWHSLRSRLLPYALYALLFIAIFRLYFFPTPTSSVDPLLTPPPLSKGVAEEEGGCDYTNGKWVHDQMGPLYNSTACGTIKDGQNCASHGRPDTGYLYWRWKPNKCHLPRFDPNTFLQLTKNRHVAFVGDSLARNQLESLLCLLATLSLPNLIYTSGDDNKFRKWHFASPHNVTVSVYWSPFLVKGFEKSQEIPYNRLYLDSVNDVWAKDLDDIDMVVLSIGHWYLHPAVFYYGDSVIGCHSCNSNHTEVGFYGVYGMAFNTTLKVLVNRGIDVIVTTFSPAHFEGDWDSLDACSKTKPNFNQEESELEGKILDYEMRRQEMEQVISAKKKKSAATSFGKLEALDVTKLALMRPDGHPGPYMYPFPFANGKRERVPNDCVHWCLPGPIDTWNEIMLDIMKRWKNI